MSFSLPSPTLFQITIVLLMGVSFAFETTAATVTILDTEVSETERFAEVFVLIMGGEDIQNLSLGFSVGDGGPLFGGAEEVTITDIRYQGSTIFDGAPLLTSEAVALPARGATIANATVNSANTDVSAGSPFDFETALVFTLDVGSLSAGDTRLLNPNAGTASQASNSRGGLVPLTFNSGLLRISAVPEPGSVVALIVICGAALLQRRRNPLRLG